VLLAVSPWLYVAVAQPEAARARQEEAVGAKAADAPLPIRHVVLFNTGVGYFQHEGQVDGTARVELTFPAYDMNDLLKSLILQDGGGGKINSVNYDSYDPIEKTLRSFAIDLSANPSFGQILNQTRGEKIEVMYLERPEQKPGDKKEEKRPTPRIKVDGTIVGMETQPRPAEKGEMEVLNLTTAAGLESIPLEQVLSVRFLNQTIEKEFQRALQVLARAHDTQKKTISLGFQGNGKRTVRVGYVVERPIWKTTYRLRIEGDNKLFLQAWAMVENTSDDDWNNVDMVLVSGRPISYKMKLYEPLYIPRPEVEPELFASLRPPLYSGSMEGKDVAQKVAQDIDKQAKTPPQIQFAPVFPQQQGFLAGPQYLVPGGIGGMMGMGGMGGGMNGLQGFQGNFGMNGAQPFNNRYANPNYFGNTLNMQGGQGNYFNAKITYEQLQDRQRLQKQVQAEAKKVIAGLNFKEGVASVASAEEVGDYHQYVVDQKITLPRQKSAMLPILNKGITGAKVSIYNHAVQARFPLLGIRLKNTSGQPLTQGPITVYEGQTYAGDTRVLDLQPGEERLLSYAVDQSTEVVVADTQSPGPDLYFKVTDDQLATNYKVRHTRSYTLKNRSTHERTTIIEHPITSGWKLLEPEKATEKSRDVYRFEVKVPAGKSLTFKVTEEETRDDRAKFHIAGYERTLQPRDDIHVKLVHKTLEPKIAGMRFEKGILHLKKRTRESTAYFVQNLSTEERTANIDYVIRPDWKLLLEDDAVKIGPAVQRVTLKLPAKRTTVREFIDERFIPEIVPPLATLTDERVKELLASPAGSAEVKAGLTKAMDLQHKLREAKAQQTTLEAQLKALTTDQARMRDNLTIIPQSSEPYKKFLEKFVAQETEIESLQKQLRNAQSSVQQVQREYDLFIANLNAE
jgi:hypothetical protein